MCAVCANCVEEPVVCLKRAIHGQRAGVQFGKCGFPVHRQLFRVDAICGHTDAIVQIALQRCAYQSLGALHYRRLKHQHVVSATPNHATLDTVRFHIWALYFLLGNQGFRLNVCVLLRQCEAVLLVLS